MMRYQIFIIVVFVCFKLKAQNDGKRLPSLKIPRIDIPEPNKNKGKEETAPQYSLNKPFEPKLFKVPPKKYDPPKTDKEMQMTGGGSDLDLGKLYAEKMNDKLKPQIKEGVLDPKAFRKHQYFGDFTIDSETITLNYRDFGEVDGDQVQVWVNGKNVTDYLYLEGFRKKIIIYLTEGINHIEIEALNEGTFTPNTGEFLFTDSQSKILMGDKWGLATGFKAKFNITRIVKNSKTIEKK
ncbi:hypothetical protein B0A78_05840 [Flavobacterium columnare NBRC 100251 = ATCC 23463]|uniref:Uncharacterized protein n=2 Tax=Flavobacterium columnare TaxID=996 RepID=G8XB80_FLACA|nr:hypothetical protein [Flavobacterium columnare]AEW86048.1 hypothetical protein FCOL_06135 [Flavobacterium columnare ATCC 49512]APT21289.1 hypothetical protein BU993_00760 [Flavobacterium columnare]PDS24986.1 hypothetical protein B0A78_05840 [Flavobacterium columnare NBRC 100251 = ATCC 23463]GEM57670.1 hypothetical protein FC1_09080 [Flavobacterium columnare NBRC 100251 = ATCC 23463]